MQFVSGIRGNQTLVTARLQRAQNDSAQVQTLSEGNTQAIKARPGLAVRVVHGMIWLTQEGDAVDIILRAGQSWTAIRKGKVVVQGVGNEENASWVIQ